MGVVTVSAAKGGAGKTTVATNLALALVRDAGHRVCLVDLDLGYGDLAAAFGHAPRRHLLDWSLRGDDDRERLARVVTPLAAGVDVVSTPTGTGGALRVPVATTDGLISTLSLHYDTVVVDTSARLSPPVLSALDCSHHHLVVATPERSPLRNLRLHLDALDLLGYDATTRGVVLNRCRDGHDGDVDGLPVLARVPVSADVPASLDAGVPLVASRPDHPVSRAISHLARRLVPAAAGHASG